MPLGQSVQDGSLPWRLKPKIKALGADLLVSCNGSGSKSNAVNLTLKPREMIFKLSLLYHWG